MRLCDPVDRVELTSFHISPQNIVIATLENSPGYWESRGFLQLQSTLLTRSDEPNKNVFAQHECVRSTKFEAALPDPAITTGVASASG